jgi:hypothetical protein
MTTLAWIILAFIGGIAAAAIIAIFIEGRKNGDPTIKAWEKIRPIIASALVEAVKIYNANQLGYDALVKYCVSYVKDNVDKSDFLLPEEKAVLT